MDYKNIILNDLICCTAIFSSTLFFLPTDTNTHASMYTNYNYKNKLNNDSG